MVWLLLALASALFLGLYDVTKKLSLNHNAVMPVLFFSSLSASLFVFPIHITNIISPETLKPIGLYGSPITMYLFWLVLIKSAIVVASWTLSFFAVKHLPLTIVAPIRSTGPFWTMLGAVFILGERLTPMQWVGIGVTLIFFYLFTNAGKKEGISFRTNKWLWLLIGGTLLGAISGMYDKFLMQRFDRITIQIWFTYLQVLLVFPLVFIIWWPVRKANKLEWRWTIPFIGILLILADFVYFYALSYPDALLTLVSALRRCSVVVAFSLGAFIFKERNLKQKALLLVGLLVGILVILLAK